MSDFFEKSDIFREIKMAISIPSADFVATCLLMVDFDLDASIADVIAREEAYEQRQGNVFGVGAGDFSNAFYALVLRGDIDCALSDLPALLAATPLRQWIPVILRLNEFYTKDTEDWWTEDTAFEVGSEFNYITHNAPFRSFFANIATLTPDAVRAFVSDKHRVV